MVEQDAFTANVGTDGLRFKNDIKILICYILDSVNAPLSPIDIEHIIIEKALANLFEVREAMASLEKMGNILLDDHNCYVIGEKGKEIANQLHHSLPFTVREKAAQTAFALLADAKIKKENKVEIEETERGFDVTCHISGGDFDLFKFTLYVPDKLQAKFVQESFYKDPQSIYKLFLSWLTDADVM